MLSRLLLTGLLLSALALVDTASAQPPVPRDAAFALMADPGRWVEVDGKFQADGTLLGKEVEIIALEDTSNMEETHIYGAIEKLDRRRSTMMVLGYRVGWDKETTIKDPNKHRILSSKLENGMAVKVQGHLRDNGIFWAGKLKLKEQDMKSDGSIEDPKEKLVGPVTVLDERGGWIRILNTDILLRPDATYVEMPPDWLEEDEDEDAE